MPGDLPKEPRSSEITTEAQYHGRREFIRNTLLYLGTSAGIGGAATWLASRGSRVKAPDLAKAESLPGNPEIERAAGGAFNTDDPKTPYADVTTYNNFYEFGTSKSDPAENAHTLKPRPWAVSIEGEIHKPRTVDVDQLVKWFPLEERVYRMRCVEAWSMVIPWLGLPLGKLLERVEPTSKAKYVSFTTLYDLQQMPLQKFGNSLPWPYAEGLRLDEAMHPLTMLAVGLYGKTLPNQNGAPLRLVVPWKYGFKGIKSIVTIRVTEHKPSTSWNLSAPDEYGFYANVNPRVDHPRWSQAEERRIGESSKRATLPFNGYAEQVAHLYKDMDLEQNF